MAERIAYILGQRRNLEFKAEWGLRLGLAINLPYALLCLLFAIVFRHAWMRTLAFYYIWLSTQRALLASKMNKDERTQWRSYLLSGALLLLSSLVIIGMNIMLLRGVKQIRYPYYILYGVAAYAFYAIISAIVNVVRYRRLSNPIFMASKAISLVTAMISMLTLQSALLTAHGDDEGFNRMMGIASGFAIFLIVVALSLMMVIRGLKQLAKAC